MRLPLSKLIRMRNAEEAKQRFRDYAAKGMSLTGPVGWNPISYAGGGSGLQINTQTDQQLATIYSKSDIVFACVHEIQSAVPEANLTVCYDDADGETVQATDHEALMLFYENPLYSYTDIMQLTVGRSALTGASFAQLGNVDQVFGYNTFVPLPTGIVKYEAMGPEIKKFYVRTSSGEPTMVDPSAMCWHMKLDPAHFMHYMSPLASAMKYYVLDNERVHLTSDLLRNKNIAPGFFVPERQVTPQQRDQFNQSYDAAWGNDSGNRGKVPMLPQGVTFVKGAEFSDIDFSALTVMSETRICMVFQVSPILIGAKAGLDSSTYANYDSARKSFYKETVAGWWSYIANGLTRAIFGDQSDSSRQLYFKFDTSSIPELQADKKMEAERAALLFEKGVITRGQAQSIAGVDIEEDEELANVYKQASAPAAPPPASGADDGSDGDEDGKSLHGKASPRQVPVRQSNNAIGDFETANIKAELDREFRRQKTDINRLIARGKSPQLNADHDHRLAKALAKPMGRVYERYGKDALRGIIGKVGPLTDLNAKDQTVDGAFDVVLPDLEAQMNKNLLKVSEDINGKTNDLIQDAIRKAAAAVTEEITRKDILKAVGNVFSDLDQWRSDRIAKTEWSRAQNDARILASSATGQVQGMKVLVSADACEICQEYDAEGNPTGIPNYPYTSMDAATAQVGEYNRTIPPFHPNCRCSSVPVLIGEPIPEYNTRQIGKDVPSDEAEGEPARTEKPASDTKPRKPKETPSERTARMRKELEESRRETERVRKETEEARRKLQEAQDNIRKEAQRIAAELQREAIRGTDQYQRVRKRTEKLIAENNATIERARKAGDNDSVRNLREVNKELSSILKELP